MKLLPLLDLAELNAEYQSEIEAALLRVARSGWYILDKEVSAFEEEWAAYCGVSHCVAMGNGLDALWLLLRAHGIGHGHEVIVPANTFIATWLAVTLAGARPVPVDCDNNYNIDPRKVQAAITSHTRAIIAVHLYGRCADMAPLRTTARANNLWLFEDAAQAHGARYGDKLRAGALAHGAAFSFYPSKNLGAMGDAGCVTTDDAAIASTLRRMRTYGGGQFNGRLDHTMWGINTRMDELQAAVLRAKLKHLDRMNAARQQRAAEYTVGLEVLPSLHLPPQGFGDVHHQYVVRSPRRDELMHTLNEYGIDTHVHYPVPPHLTGAYKELGYKVGDFPETEYMADTVFSLPIGNNIDTTRVVQAVHKASRSYGRK